MREKPQLGMREIGGKKLPTFSLNESTPNVATELSPDRDVLKVRVIRRETTRRCDRLAVRRVKAPGVRIHQRRKSIYVRALQLRHLTILHEQRGQFVPGFSELLEDARIR